ncbi:response regulator [Heyndrickxia ginsengihumi]|uniref:Response regulator n=1 Tax=Heyndrickxia ginsengihumi TaxID=363870 RepID=A0A6M0P1N8_9BACI|nr:response regulator [Heyndrickxia ginsengihumi]MBE6184712.1 response regulator [Bacillus sp. (in: firmicutes)]MCM3022179.1 response regulator [Heyndrickxia ginsengihumi]NEY18411.1 response regulator [Heyndrickxia ginsengihumi]
MSKEKILIVDDQFGIRILLTEVLQKEGYETFQAANGVQALELVKKYTFDLVLLDMKIPGMDGIEILKRMKKIHSDIRVIIMTAYGELDMIEETKKLGALTHFAKPFDIDDIRKAVKESLLMKAD